MKIWVKVNVGKLELLDKMLKDALVVNENYTLKLFKNNVVPSSSSITSTFVEANFSGYVEKNLTRAGWVASTIVSNKAQSRYPQQSWTCGSIGQVIYGYYVISSSSSTLLWAELFSSPKTLVPTDVLNIIPVFTFNSQD